MNLHRYMLGGWLFFFVLVGMGCSKSNSSISLPGDENGPVIEDENSQSEETESSEENEEEGSSETDKKIDPFETMDDLVPDGSFLGANYNGQFQFIDFADLERTQTEWVRGFIDFFQFYNGGDLLNTDEGVMNYLKLKENGYKTILNIKWDFRVQNMSIPDTSSPIMMNYLSFLEDILNKVWDYTDLLVIGNEIYIDTKPEDQGIEVVLFNQKVAHFVADYQNEKASDKVVPVFIGAFNNLYLKSWRTESVHQLLNFVKTDPTIAGIDLHIHHDEVNQIRTVMDYSSGLIRDNQKIIITEFSLMKHFKSNLNNGISPFFAAEYGYSPTLRVYQYINNALKAQVPKAEWDDFLRSSPWFENSKNYLSESMDIFRDYPNFLGATYGIRQSYPFNTEFTAQTDPWILNSIFANRTVEVDEKGAFYFNYGWIDDFQKLQ